MIELMQMIFGEFYGNIVGHLLLATQWTIYLSLTAFLGGGLIGLTIAVVRITQWKTARRIAAGYVWLFQSIPLLMLLFLIGLGVPSFFQIDVPPWIAATLALTLFTSAYISEVWRGALTSVPVSQWEAASALALNFRQSLTHVVAPQAIRIAIPPTVGFMVQIIKATSMAYIIDFNDLMRWGKKIANAQLEGAEPFVIFPMMALIYFCLCFPLSMYAKSLEKRMADHNAS